MSAADATVSCPACSKRVKFKPQLAGKKLRCACGQVFRMPREAEGQAVALDDPPVAEPQNEAAAAAEALAKKSLKVTPGEGGTYDLSDDSVSILPKEDPKPSRSGKGKCPKCGHAVKPEAVICINCGFNLRVGTQVASEVKPSKKDGSSILDAYAATARARGISQEQEEIEAARKARITELYVPIGLAILGVLAMFIKPVVLGFGRTRFQSISVILEVAVQLVLHLPFLLLAIVLTAKIMQTSFGPFMTALLKLVGLAFFTGGVGGLIDIAADRIFEGFGSLIVTPFLHFAIFWGLTVYLFALDFLEMTVLYILAALIPFYALVFLVPMALHLFF